MKRSLALLALVFVACGGAGPYGYARTYAPTGGEEAATRNAKPFDAAMLAERTGIPALAWGLAWLAVGALLLVRLRRQVF